MDSSDIQSIELIGHSDTIRCLAVSPTDQLVASASWDSTLRLWSAQGGQVAVLNGHRAGVNGVAFSPDGATIISGSTDKTIKLWNVASREETTTLNVEDPVWCIACSPDGALLAAGSDTGVVRLWDVASRARIKILRGHRGQVVYVAFSHDSKTVASASYDYTIRLWQVGSGDCYAILQQHKGLVFSVAFSPAGDILASCSDDKTVILWDIATKAPTVTLHGHTDQVISVAFSPSGKFLASAAGDMTIQLWNVASRSRSATLKGHSGAVCSVSFSADGYQLASGAKDSTVRLWHLPSPFIPEPPIVSTNQDDAISPAFNTLRLHNDLTSLISLGGSVLIGVGGFGEVISATHRHLGKVALKRTQKFPDDTSARRFLREVNLWRSVSHQYILPCLGMCEFDSFAYVVSPFIENGDLRSCISNGVSFNRTRMLYEVAEALAHLHHREIIHGDVKAQNVLLSNDRSALLCDFGLSKALDSMATSTENKGAGSVRWMAPELFDNEPRSMASDVYSFGITIAEVLSGQAPYPNITDNIAVAMHVLLKGGRPPKVPSQSPDGRSYSVLWETAEKCWAKEAKDRPYMVQVLGMLFPLARERN